MDRGGASRDGVAGQGDDATEAVADGLAGEFEAFGGIDGAAPAGEGDGVKPPGGDEGTENVAGKIGGLPGGDEVEDFGGTEADAGVDPGRFEALAIGVGGAFEEAGDPTGAVGVEGDDAVGTGSGMDEEGGEGASLAMDLEEGPKILIGEDVAVLDEEGFLVAEERGDPADAAGGAEELFLVGVVEAEVPPGAIPEPVPNDFGAEMEVDGDVGEALRAEVTEEVGEEREALAEVEHGLGPVAGEFAEAGAEAGAEDHGFHGIGRKTTWTAVWNGKWEGRATMRVGRAYRGPPWRGKAEDAAGAMAVAVAGAGAPGHS